MNDEVAIKVGIHPLLEAEANRIIFESLRGVTSQAEKSDILTPWKEADRRSREVLAAGGTVDPALRRGMYHRAANAVQTHLNGRDGTASRPRGFRDLMSGDWPTSYEELGA